ncbi:hypothetical protein C5167_023692 [Papaver somniferum]|uniref:Uncharacterized protein n=1 Tax=Papaver somniferum TaxID=3469 RepID=A0A4Y7JQD6_PAPSO|nr:hypothetical protein C5167_023692 [Papaver somniferum]
MQYLCRAYCVHVYTCFSPTSAFTASRSGAAGHDSCIPRGEPMSAFAGGMPEKLPIMQCSTYTGIVKT